MINKKYNLEKIYKKINETIDRRLSILKNHFLFHSIVLKDNKISHYIEIFYEGSYEKVSNLEYSITENEFIEGYLSKELFEDLYFKLKKEWRWLNKN